MNKIYIQYYKSPVGDILLGAYDNKLCLADWRYRKMRDTIDSRIQNILDAQYTEETSNVIEKTITQLEEYFLGKRKDFDIPILMVGTEFQKFVWEALQQIPYGKTASYQELSTKLGKPKAVRAVANANGANAISILIPCHRIIGSDGSLTGYAGGIETKKKLLNLENNLFT